MTGGSGCWICNPMCGKCQPPALKSHKCPECGETTVFEKAAIKGGETLRCKKCGYDMTDLVVPVPIRCNYSGKICAYPCGKSTSPKHDLGYQPCLRNTPPSAEWVAAHPDV